VQELAQHIQAAPQPPQNRPDYLQVTASGR
jgi:hypothetical protein